MSKMTGEDKFWAALGGQRSKTPAADALQQSPGAWAGMVQEKLQIPGASQFWESIRNAPQAAPQQTPGTGEVLTPGKWLGGLGNALGQTRSVGEGAVRGTADALGATVQQLPGLQQLAQERVQRGLFTAGTTEETNRMVNDYLRQQAAYQSTKDDRKNLQAEQKKLEKKYASGTVSKEYYEIKKKKIAQELEEMGSAPVRTMNAKDYANQHSSAGQEDAATRQKRAEAAKWQRLMEAEARNWQEAQAKYQPDSRDYAAAKDRYNTKYRSYRALYNAAAKQLPEAYTETEKRQQQNEQDIAALGNRLQAAYDDIDERFAGENPETNPEYQAALQNVEALRQQYDRLTEEQQKLEAEKKDKWKTDTEARAAAEQELQDAEEALQKAEEIYYEVPGGDFDAAQNQYLAAEDRVKAARQRLEEMNRQDASAKARAAMQEQLNEQDRTLQRYETDRYREDFQTVADSAKSDNPSWRQDPVGYLLGHFSGQMAGASDDAKRWVMLSDDELEEYYYLLGSQGKDAAMKYMDALEVTLDKRRTEYQQANTEMLYGTSGAVGKTVMNVASVPASVIGGITSGVADVKSAIAGKFNPYSPGHELTDYATTVRGVTARDIMSRIDNPFWSKIAGNTYQALMSGADSALGATLFGNGYTWIMGSNAASQRARELYEKGASGAQIGLGAIASGLIEVATENYSIEYFTQSFLEGDIKGFRDWAKKTLIQGLNEGSEEVASDLANLVADAFIEGAGSDYQQGIQELIDQGMDPEEAKKQAFRNQVEDTFWSFYGGAVSGGAMGGIGGAMNAGAQKSQQRAAWRGAGESILENNGLQELLDTAQGLNVNEKLLQLAQERAAKRAEGYRASQRQENRTRQALGKLYEQVLNAQAAAGDNSIQAAFQGAAEQALEGKVENPQTAAAAVAKTAAGEQLTEQEQAALQTVEGAGGVDAIVRQVQESPEFRQAAVTQREAVERTAGLTADKESALNPENIRAAKETVAAAAEDYDNPQEMISAYRQGQDPEAFIAGYRAAYNYGSIGLDERWSLKSRNTQGRLTEEQILAAHNAGRKAAGYEQAEGNLSESQKWNDMRSAQQQGAAVAEGTAIQEAGSQTDAAGAGAADGAVRKVSAQVLGLRNGTAEENLTVTPKEQYGKAERAAAEYAESQGLNLTVVTGGSIKTVEQVDGKDHLVKSRALIDGDTMIVRGDDPMFTAEQLVRHEAAHRQIENGEIDLGKATRELVQKYSAARVKEIIRLYAEGYSGSGMNAKQVLEEIVCDSMGGMNAFATESTARVAGEVGAFLRDAQRASQGGTLQAQKKNAQVETGVDVKYSREMAQQSVGALQAEIYQLKSQREEMLEADAAYQEAKEQAKYANTFAERVAASKALKKAAGNIDTLNIDRRIEELRNRITEIREGEITRHREEQEKYSGAKTKGYALEPDTRIKKLDADYMAAVKAKNKQKMQEFVAQAAEAAMPRSVVRDKNGNLLKVYHYTNNDFSVFDRGMARTGNEMDGFFFAPDAESTKEYGNRQIAAYLNIVNLALDPVLDRTFNDSGTLLREKLAAQGYDGVARTENGKIYEYMVFDSNQVKSADAVTYDADGNVIPLSQRFNAKESDIRYSREMDSEGNTLTEAQEKYFAGSQVRDEEGNLIPVHHRTDTEFYTFKRSGLGQNTLGNASDAALAATALVGHWFSDHEIELGSKDVKAYLNIQNPYQTSLDALAAKIASFAKNPEQMQERYEEGQYNMVRKAARDYVQWMKENGYDGLEVSDSEFGGKSYVILDSRQAKLTDNQNPTGKNDIRYSREMDRVEELERQNELLRQRVDYWHMQTAVTVGKPGADKAQVRTLARQLINQYGSQTRTSEILPELQWLADNRRTESETVTEQDLFDTAENVAKTILDGSSIDVNAEQKEQAKALRRFLNRRYINVDESLKEDIGDFKDWKKQNRALHFREDGTGTGVDTLWQELQEDFGKGMFPDSIANPADQIRHIADKLDSMQELWQAPYSAEMETAVSQLRSQIMAEVLELGDQQPTRADKAIAKTQRELEWLVKQGTRKEQRRVESAAQTILRRQIWDMNSKFQRMALKPGKGTTQHAPQELLGAVQNFCELFTESEERWAGRWQEQLDTRTGELMQRMNGDYVSEAAQEEYRKIAGSQERLDKMTARISRLQAIYSALAKGENDLVYDETVNGMLQSLRSTLEGTDVYEMSSRELQKVKETMTALMYTVTEANKAFSMGKDATVVDVAKKWAREMRQVNHQTPGLKAMSGRYWMWQMTPDTFFNYTCGYIKDNEGQSIQKAFQRGSERMMEVQREYYDMFQEFTESKDKAVQKELKKLMNEPLKNMVEIGIKDQAGNEVKVSRGMMLQIYMMLQQKDSFESLKFGGFALPNAEAYYKGKVQEAYGNAEESAMISEAAGKSYMDLLYQLKQNKEKLQQMDKILEEAKPEEAAGIMQQIRQLEEERRGIQGEMEGIGLVAEKRLTKIMENIEKQLTPLERQLMDKAHEWYSHTGELMGDVFLQMYGYMPRLVENYVPIHRDPSTIKTDIRNMSGAEKAFNLENSGFTIERVRNFQPILLTDFFQELEGQKEKMSRYVGFAQVQKDFGKIWKTRVSGNGMTINKLIAAKFGAGSTKFGVSGVDFVEHYIADVAGGHKSEDVLSDLYGNYAAATLRLNPRVAVSQAASIPTAASVVGWKSMAAGFAKGLPKAMSTKYRNDLAAKNVWFWQRYRGQGGSTELADIRQKGNVIEKVANSNVGKKLFNWCQTVDVFSTGSIMWSAAEDYVQRTKGIQPGAEGYEAAVNETYTDIIRKSQPNYTTTERADLLRDQRAHMKLLTMFKTQSSQNLNLLMEANGEFIRMRQDFKNGVNGVTAADVKAAKVKLANASTGVFLGGTVAFVGLRTIMNFILGAVNPYRDKDTDEVTLGGTLKGMGKEVLSSLSGTVAMGGQIYDIMMSVISGDTYYGLSDSAISTIGDTLENTQKVLTNLLDSDKEVTGNQVWKMTNSWCQAFGIPAGNAKKIYTMFDTYIRDIRAGKLGQYTTDYTTTSQYRERVVQGVLRGENQRADDALAMLFAKSGEDTDEKIEKDIASGMRTYLKNQYMAAEITDLEAIRVMEYTGTEDPEAVIARWEFMLEHPEVDSVSDNLVTAYNNRGNLDGETVIAAYKFKGQASKEETVQYIQGLTISASDKKKLWDLIKGSWKDKDTPWA